MSLDAYFQAKERFDQAFAMMAKRQWQQALDGFEAVLALNPKHTQSYGNMGICYG